MFRRKLKNSFYLTIFLISIFSISFGYALLNSTLIIMGTSAIQKNTWDVHFENLNVTKGSVTATTAPSITESNRISDFTFVLDKRGDFYEFTVDIVNSGSLDAMIDSVEMTPSLTTEQEKYLTYTITYENNEEIKKNQLIKVNDSVRIKVRVEFKSNITASDLPQTQQVLNLGFHINYVQADESGNLVDNNGRLIKVVSGTGTTIGDEVCIGEECFYVISSTNEKITMLSKYNLHVGYKYDSVNGRIELENPTGIQSSDARGWFSGYSEDNPSIGSVYFASTNYWSSTTSVFPSYVYDNNSLIYEHLENYKNYLSSKSLLVDNIRLISVDELSTLGCVLGESSCRNAPAWIYSTSYWTGSARSTSNIVNVRSNGDYGSNVYNGGNNGVRPVIEIDRNYIPIKLNANGSLDEIGTIVTIGSEQFYTIGTEGENVKLLAKYNLLVGNKYDAENDLVELENPTGIQDSTAIGWFSGYSSENPIIGTRSFSNTNYWVDEVSSYPAYVFNEKSYLYDYIENYKKYLNSLGANSKEVRLITFEELKSLGCDETTSSCSNAPAWVYSTTYWTGTAFSTSNIWYVSSAGKFSDYGITSRDRGVRPVIVMAKREIKVIEKRTIEFTIEGVKYQAEEGMTLAEWVESEYNIDGFILDDEYVCDEFYNYYVTNNIGKVNNETVILNDFVFYKQLII